MFRAPATFVKAFCPKCKGPGGMSNRRLLLKQLLRKVGVYVFRCQSCKRRFFRFRPVRKWPSHPSGSAHSSS